MHTRFITSLLVILAASSNLAAAAGADSLPTSPPRFVETVRPQPVENIAQLACAALVTLPDPPQIQADLSAGQDAEARQLAFVDVLRDLVFKLKTTGAGGCDAQAIAKLTSYSDLDRQLRRSFATVRDSDKYKTIPFRNQAIAAHWSDLQASLAKVVDLNEPISKEEAQHQKEAQVEQEEADREKLEFEASQADRESVKSDVAKARAKGMDKVFGIPLGEPLSLPDCADSLDENALQIGTFSSVTETCKEDLLGEIAAGLSGLMLKALLGPNPEATKYWHQTTVRLADNKCPDWLRGGGSCVLLFTVEGGITIAAALNTPDERFQKKIVEKLAEKYSKPWRLDPQTMSSCTYPKGAEHSGDDREWKPPGLHVTYNPLQEDCAHGRVLIETETAYRARLKARQQREDSQSKL